MTITAAQCWMAAKALTGLTLCAALAGCGGADAGDVAGNGGGDQGGAAGSNGGRGASGGTDTASGAGMGNWSGRGSDAGGGNASGPPSAGSGGTSLGGQVNAGSAQGGSGSPGVSGAAGAAVAGRGMGGGGRNAGGGRAGAGGGGRSAAGTPGGGTTAEATAQEYVDAHNAVRAAVQEPPNYTGTWMPLPPVTWSPEVAATAQAWAENLRDTNGCGLRHAQNTGYGENLAGGSGKMAPSRAVELWAGEEEDYTYNAKYAFEAGTGHYTQIVWRTSVQIGCGSATCSNGSTVICCRYSPPGNYIGRAPY